MKIVDINTLKGSDRHGSCTECEKDSTEDKYMRKIVFENNDDKSRIVQLSATVCQDCLNNMLDLIGNYLNSGGRIPW